MRSELSNRPGTPDFDVVEIAVPAPKKKIYLEETDNG
jgi:hypothetical protein